jgi:Tfp pilus assembly protein PilN
MIKVKINLLPKEIRDRRKGEKFILAGLAVIVATVLALGFTYTYNKLSIESAEKELSQLKAKTEKMQSSIQALQVYEQKLADINGKKGIIDRALASKIEWSKELEELMIVTPNEVSLSKLTGSATGLNFSGTASDASDSIPDLGHKAVAKWLMRLADTSKKPDVWLTSSDKDDGSHTLKFSNTLKFTTVAAPVALPSSPAASQPTANQTTPNGAGK